MKFAELLALPMLSGIIGIAPDVAAAAAHETTLTTAISGIPNGLVYVSGAFYGWTPDGVASNGDVYRLVPPSPAQSAWTAKPVAVFSDPTYGLHIDSSLVRDKAGNLYGTTFQGGTGSGGSCYPTTCGVLFKLTPHAPSQQYGTEQTIFNFQSPSGSPEGPIAIDPSGTLFVVLNGTVAAFSPPAGGSGPYTMKTIYAGSPYHVDGGVVRGRSGALYGVATQYAGSSSYNIVYRLAPSRAASPWTLTVLKQFDPAVGVNQVYVSPTEAVFGTTPTGAGSNCSQAMSCSVFTLSRVASSPQWTLTTIHSFAGDPLGSPLPSQTGSVALVKDALSFGPDGSVYGAITPHGGNNSTIYRLAPPAGGQTGWTETALYTFADKNGDIGGSPMLITRSGTIFGTAISGDSGVAFRITVSP